MTFKDELISSIRGDWTDIRFHLPYLYGTAIGYDKRR
jgi:hypothetical protein